MSRTDTIAAVLRRPHLLRPIVAHELRGPLVQGLDRGTTVAWQATVPQLAEAIDTALQEEEKDIPADAGTAFTALPSDGHALIIRPVGGDFIGSCQCGQALGRTPRTKPVDHLVGLWERHTAPIADQAWADALTALPTTASVNGAS